MVDYLLLVPVIASFFISLVLMPFWIRKTRDIKLVWEDMNKTDSGKVAGSGGVIVVLAFVIGVLMFIAYRTFIVQNTDFLISILALLTSVFFLASIGFIDDILGWQKGGIRKRDRIALVALAAIPLMAINAGGNLVSVPLLGLGSFDLGLIYPLILIPVGIIGAATTFNFLAGFNGLEAGNGILILSALSIVAFLTGNSWLSVIGLCMVASLLGFLIFNFYPAKIFPGDSLTYVVGGLIAIMSILGNFEKIAVFFFIPVIIEVFLKGRGRFVKQSFGLPKKDNSLDLRYDKVYSLNHLAIIGMKKLNIKPTEKRVVYLIWAIQFLVIAGGFLIFKDGIFG